jgi:hypothetical protein
VLKAEAGGYWGIGSIPAIFRPDDRHLTGTIRRLGAGSVNSGETQNRSRVEQENYKDTKL